MPNKVINILLLGETGVGKSTWINAFPNYCKFLTLGEAKNHGGIFPIPAVFHVTDPVSKKLRPISTDPGSDLSACTPAGQSITQDPEEHIFCVGNLSVNLIDTPGLLNTGDADHHSIGKNVVDNTFAVLSMYKEISAIFIFLKATDARMNQPFIYCLTEIFRRLHRSASDNVVFIFTYAAGACYTTDMAQPVIEKFLDQYKVPIKIPPPIFCFENSTVKNLTEHKNGIVDGENNECNERAWNSSAEALEACMKHCLSLEQHPVANTVSIHWASCTIVSFFLLVVDVIKCIDNDISGAEDQQRCAEDLKQKIAIHPASFVTCLQEKSFIKETKVNIEKTAYINYVCESAKCISKPVSDDTQIFSQICFEGLFASLRAYLSNSAWSDDPSSCKQVCSVCGCARKDHSFRWFKVYYVTEHVPLLDDAVTEIRSSQNALDHLNKVISDCKSRAADLQAEEEEILVICAELVVFMRQNALIEGESQTDTVQRKLLRFLNDEIEKYTFAVKSGATQMMKERRDKLRKMTAMFEKHFNVEEEEKQYSAADVKQLIEKLYRLPITGSQIKQVLDDVQKAWQQHTEDAKGRRQCMDLNESALLSRVVGQVFDSSSS